MQSQTIYSTEYHSHRDGGKCKFIHKTLEEIQHFKNSLHVLYRYSSLVLHHMSSVSLEIYDRRLTKAMYRVAGNLSNVDCFVATSKENTACEGLPLDNMLSLFRCYEEFNCNIFFYFFYFLDFAASFETYFYWLYFILLAILYLSVYLHWDALN